MSQLRRRLFKAASELVHVLHYHLRRILVEFCGESFESINYVPFADPLDHIQLLIMNCEIKLILISETAELWLLKQFCFSESMKLTCLSELNLNIYNYVHAPSLIL